jgi:hypothetical protein
MNLNLLMGLWNLIEHSIPRCFFKKLGGLIASNKQRFSPSIEGLKEAFL